MNVKLLLSVATAALLVAPAAHAIEADKAGVAGASNEPQTRSLTGIVPSPLVMFGASVFMGALAVVSREVKR